MADPVLAHDEVDGALAGGGGELAWERDGDRLVRSVRCDGFRGALAFVNAVGELAEAANHHPDIDIRWNTVHLALTSHDVGGITGRDLDLARRIDGVATGS